MPIVNGVTFLHSKLLDPALGYRAWADVYVFNPGNSKKSQRVNCMVDTGADYTVLPIRAAKEAGLTIPTNSIVTPRTISGQRISLQLHPDVKVEVEGYPIRVAVAFSPSTSFTPIIGRRELMLAFDFGFDETYWYWG